MFTHSWRDSVLAPPAAPPPHPLPQIEVLASFVISTVLNGALLFQFFYYNFFSGKKQAAGKAGSEEPKSGSSSGARRRAKRD